MLQFHNELHVSDRCPGKTNASKISNLTGKVDQFF